MVEFPRPEPGQYDPYFQTYLDKVPADVPDIMQHLKKQGLVFLNLLKNAVEASAPGGEITVKTQVPVGGPISTQGAPRSGIRGGFLEVVVTDEGQGFDPNIKEYTTPFITTKSKGVGLGLGISEQIVHNHGGSLVLDNGEGGGAIVRVYLPLNSG